MADYIARWLEPLGVELCVEEVSEGHPNLIAILRGTGGGRSLCLNSHLDTVGYAYRKDYFRLAGISSPPTTWEDYIAVAGTISAMIMPMMASTTSSFPTALQPLTMYQLSSQPSTTVLRTRGS